MFRRFKIPRLHCDMSDVLFVFFTLTIMQHATQGMMDDPGLGWHLRIPDLMMEKGGFVYSEYFSFPSTGNRWVTRAWLSDAIMRIGYAWGGLNAVAMMTCMTIAVTLRCIYRRLVSDGAHWIVSIAAIIIGVMGLVPSFVARPNIVSFLGVWLVADLCQRFHADRLTHKQLFWLVPILLVWTNMHGGFMAGLVLIAIAWAVELALTFFSFDSKVRASARPRLLWLTLTGLVAGLATLINPNGIGLHLYNLQAVTDPFIQNNTTVEWLPPDFRQVGWFNIERLILVLPLLAATCRKRVNLTGLVMTVAWLHFALTSRRYSTLWVVIALPTLCELAVNNQWLRRAAKYVASFTSPEIASLMTIRSAPTRRNLRLSMSIAAATLLLLASAWLPSLTSHNPKQMPSASLDRFLKIHNGESTFHWANWGGYLTWKGWDRPQRFKTWIDDRIEVHGKQHTLDYFTILQAQDGWQDKLNQHQVTMVCIPNHVRLAATLKEQEGWESCFSDQQVSVFRRKNVRQNEEVAIR